MYMSMQIERQQNLPIKQKEISFFIKLFKSDYCNYLKNYIRLSCIKKIRTFYIIEKNQINIDERIGDTVTYKREKAHLQNSTKSVK